MTSIRVAARSLDDIEPSGLLPHLTVLQLQQDAYI